MPLPIEPPMPGEGLRLVKNAQARKPPFGIGPPSRRHWPPPKYDTTVQPPKKLPSTGGGTWYEPSTWVHDALGFLGHAASITESWVVRIVRDAANLLFQEIRNLWGVAGDFVEDAIHYAERLGRAAEHLIQAVWDDLYHLAKVAIRGFKDVAIKLYRAVDGLIVRIGRAFAHAVSRAFLDMYRWIAHHVMGILHGLVYWVNHAVRWLDHHLAGWWRYLYRHVIKPIEHDITAVEGDVARIATLIDHEIIGAVHLVEKAGKWLEWFALHGLEDFVHLGEDVGETIEHWLTEPLA